MHDMDSSSTDPYQRRDRVRHKLADLYLVKPETEISFHVAIKPGVKVCRFPQSFHDKFIENFHGKNWSPCLTTLTNI
jgi:hypothetical protein